MELISVKDFTEIIKHRKGIICFGAGKNSAKMERVFKDTDILEKIVCFVDNDMSKWNTVLCIAGKRYNIISLEQLKKFETDGMVVLITSMNYVNILKQLEEDRELNSLECYWFEYMQGLFLEDISMKRNIPTDIKRSASPLIPKVLHYCWFGKSPIPEKNKKWMESWKRYCPDYEIIEWNESNYDISKNCYMKQAYEKGKWGFVPDYARLDIIYNYGGIYLDTDVEIIANMDDLLYQKGFAGFVGENYVALGLGFGAEKGLPVIKQMLNEYEKMRFVNEDGSLNMIGAPVWQTNYLKAHGLKTDGEYQIVDDLTIFPDKMFNAKNIHTRKIQITNYTKSIHHYDASWVGMELKEIWKQLE